MIDPGPGYRLLQVGEVIQDGDEWQLDREDWRETSDPGREYLGFEIEGQIYRRPVAPASVAPALREAATVEALIEHFGEMPGDFHSAGCQGPHGGRCACGGTEWAKKWGDLCDALTAAPPDATAEAPNDKTIKSHLRYLMDRIGELEAQLAQSNAEAETLRAQVAQSQQADAVILPTLQRTREILGAGNYENVDHAAQRVVDELTALRSQLAAQQAVVLGQAEWLDLEADSMGCSSGNFDGGSYENCEHCQYKRMANELRAAVAVALAATGAEKGGERG